MSGKFKVLLVGPRPKELSPLSTKEQVRSILYGAARFGHQIDLIPHFGVEFSELPGLLVATQPDILHVTAHGSEQGFLAFENARGETEAISIKRFQKVLHACSSKFKLSCIVLNSCYMGELANSLTEVVEYVIASPSKLLNQAQVSFSEVFYQMLSMDMSIEKAFDAALPMISGEDESYVLYRGKTESERPKGSHGGSSNEPHHDDASRSAAGFKNAKPEVTPPPKSPRDNSAPAASGLRVKQVGALLYEIFRSASTFDAFCLDSFPDVYRRFGNSMDRETKQTLLLTEYTADAVVKELKGSEPEKFARHAPKILGTIIRTTETADLRPNASADPPRTAPPSTKLDRASVRMASFFVSRDADHADELQRHLRPLLGSGNVEYWDLRDIQAGKPRDAQISEQLDTANVLLFLVSSDLLADATASKWIDRAMLRQGEPACWIVPISIRPALLSESPLGRLTALPADDRTISQWRNRDEAWVAVSDGIRKLLETISP